jgi:hypothetical protein
MKYIFGSFFIIGVPLACLLLVQVAKKTALPKRGAGLALLILGWVVVGLTLISYIPMIIISFVDERISRIDEIFGLFVWFVPGLSFILLGRHIRKMEQCQKTAQADSNKDIPPGNHENHIE